MLQEPIIKEDSIKDFSINIAHRKGREYFMPHKHYHDEYEIYYLTKGQRNYFIKDKIYLVNEGDLVFIASNEIHKTFEALTPNHSKVSVFFKLDFIRHMFAILPENVIMDCFNKEYPVFHSDIKSRVFIDGILKKMADEGSLGFECSLGVQKLLLCELLVYSSRLISSQPLEKLQSYSTLHKDISEIVRYLNTNFSLALTLSLVAAKFFISPSYLSKIFKEVTGFSFIEYLNHVRIKEAKSILSSNRRVNILDVALKTGFTSSTHFGRVFKGFTGTSPLKYRRQTCWGTVL